jgi:predicted Co/Zn/Cd cation transporter (cation efflux family)
LRQRVAAAFSAAYERRFTGPPAARSSISAMTVLRRSINRAIGIAAFGVCAAFVVLGSYVMFTTKQTRPA